VGLREALYDVEWQVLRVNTLPKHNALGGWGTPAGTADNLMKLAVYLRVDESVRRYRVNNLLASVLKKYRGQGLTDTPMYLAVARFKYQMPRHIAAERVKWSWQKVRDDLEQLMKEDPDTFNNVRRDLTSVIRRIHGGGDNRPELAKFLNLMKDVSR